MMYFFLYSFFVYCVLRYSYFSLNNLFIKSSRQRCSMKKVVLRNFSKFIGKHLCQSLFFNKEHLWTTASISCINTSNLSSLQRFFSKMKLLKTLLRTQLKHLENRLHISKKVQNKVLMILFFTIS